VSLVVEVEVEVEVDIEDGVEDIDDLGEIDNFDDLGDTLFEDVVDILRDIDDVIPIIYRVTISKYSNKHETKHFGLMYQYTWIYLCESNLRQININPQSIFSNKCDI
jgi:hypothetical protein